MQITAATSGMAGRYSERPLVDENFMREIGDYALSQIRRHTQAGTDKDGNAFAPLSPGYATQKQQALGSARADLTVSGRLLNEMTILSSSRNRVTIGFVGGSIASTVRTVGGTFIQRSRAVPGGDKAVFHQLAGAGRSRVKRQFFGLTSGEAESLRTKVQQYIGRITR